MPSSTRPRGTSLGNYDMRCDEMLMTSCKLWKNSTVAGEIINENGDNNVNFISSHVRIRDKACKAPDTWNSPGSYQSCWKKTAED
nr:uncharacterized protein LOC110567427 isoform X2 [Aotus nancymaae]